MHPWEKNHKWLGFVVFTLCVNFLWLFSVQFHVNDPEMTHQPWNTRPFHFSKCRLFPNKQLRLSFLTNMVSLWRGQPTGRCEKLFSQSHSQTAPASPTVCLALVGMGRGHGLQPCKSWRSEKVNTLTPFLLCKAEEGCQPSCNIQSVLSARLPPNWRVRVGNNSPAGWLPH